MKLDDFVMSGNNQARLLATIYRNENFFLDAKKAGLRTEDFEVQSCRLVYEILSEFHAKYGSMPSMSSLQDIVAEKMRETDDVGDESVKEMCWVLGIMSEESVLDYKYARDKLIAFIKGSRIGKIASSSPTDTERIEDTVKSVQDIGFDEEEDEQSSMISDCMDVLPQNDDEMDVKIPTGISWLDLVTNGGLSVTYNEIGVGMAGTGVGKTNLMINFAIAAAWAGFRSLFVTLELPKKQIIRRGVGMMAHVRAGEMRLPMSRWSKASRDRLDFLLKSKVADYISVADLSKKSHTVSDIEYQVKKWRRRVERETGDASKCKLVLIDWLDMLEPELKDAKMTSQPWLALQKVMENVRHMANNQNIAVWTVMQTNRQGSGVQKVRLDHVSGAYSKNYFASIAIGLAPVDDDSGSISQDMTDDDLMKMKTDPDRTLHLNLLKNRDGLQREADIYQGPTLKFWKSKSDWRTMERLVERGDMKKIFGDGVE